MVYSLVWSLGMLNAERPEFSNIFLNSGGLLVCLKIIGQYQVQGGEASDEFEVELESVTTFTLTSSCYEGDYQDYEVIRPIVPYL